MKVTTVVIDLAKNIFRLHGVDARGAAALHRQLTHKGNSFCRFWRSSRLVWWEWSLVLARIFGRERSASLDTKRRLMSPHFVKPYVKSNKNDANDAEAICEAVGRPSMRFVPNKNTSQQDVQALHPIREVAHGADQRDPRPARRVWDHGE
jgi:transposase